MKKEIAQKWVAALRSGEYKQGDGQLRTTDGSFCCLGVLCNLHAQEHPEIAAGESSPTMYLGEAYLLPPDVMEWAGMKTKDGKIEPHDLRIRAGLYVGDLVEANDLGASFKEIARIIDRKWELL